MDIPVYKPYLDEQEKKNVSRVLESGWLSSSGKKVKEFEKEVRSQLGVKNGIATDSGTAALHAALESVDVRGKEVIVPGLTFGATASAVKHAGGKPVPVDIEEGDLGIDPEKLENKITERTAAIIVVHLFGHPARLDEIKEIAERKDLTLIEDAAQSMGSEPGGERPGTIADIGVFSFSWNKTITTGKGGFVTAEDSSRAEKLRSIVSNGSMEGQKFARNGYNYRMDNIRGSVGLSQMEKYEEITRRKREIFDFYSEEISDISGVQPIAEQDFKPSWAYAIKTGSRKKLAEKLREKGIETRQVYPPLNQLGLIKSESSLPVSNKMHENGLILPSYPGLTEKERRHITDAIKSSINHS